MKAEITKEGKLLLIPASHSEEFALASWLNDKNGNSAELTAYFEQGHSDFYITLAEASKVVDEDAAA
jgi:hypothetical protein